jgi:RNA polymerase sigma-54 factor
MLRQNLSQKLSQKLSPQQLMYVKLLELNTLNFEQRLEEEMIENPALESGKDDDEFTTEFAEDSYENVERESAIEGDEKPSSEFEDNDIEAVDTSLDYGDITDFMEDDGGDFRLNEDYNPDFEEKEFPVVTVHTGFRDNLIEQVYTVLDTDKDEKIAEQIVGSLDDDGYLRRELRSIVNDFLFQYNIQTNTEEVEKVLKVIQRFDPPGVGARTLQECLLIQIKRKEEKGRNPIMELAKMIITDCMEDFSKRHFEKIATKLDVNVEYLKEAVTFITKLNPKPASSEEDTKNETIIPDFVVVDNYGVLDIALNQGNQPDLKINRGFIDTLVQYDKQSTKNNHAKEAVQFVKQKIDGAKWFIDAVKQRQNTLLNTMTVIVDIQKEFFKTGDSAKIRPMKLKDVAEKLMMDISTVSRVASSKYVQTDYGIFLLKYFFSEGITNEDGEEVTTKEVKRIMEAAIDNEDKNNPMNDDELTELLKTKGYTMARRTVAKYREQLNIPVARLRKAF